MLSTEPVSAVVVRVPLPPALARLRSRWDWAAGVGVPPHVTILFPFLPARLLGAAERRQLAGLAADHEPFELRFEQVGRFPTVVYLVPEPAGPVADLIASVGARYPDHPPYGGAFDEVIPHLTITESTTAPLGQIAVRAAESLPFSCRVAKLDVLVEDAGGRWRSRWRIGLGVRP